MQVGVELRGPTCIHLIPDRHRVTHLNKAKPMEYENILLEEVETGIFKLTINNERKYFIILIVAP